MMLRIIFSVIAGMIIPFAVFYFTVWSMPWTKWIIPAVFIDICIFSAVLAIEGQAFDYFKRVFILSTVIIISGCAVWSLANIGIVVARAEAIAKEQPYCIQVASQEDPFGYDTPKSLFDLSGLKMRARETSGGISGHLFSFQHHAILVVANKSKKIFNWSYRQQDFTDDIMDRQIGRSPIIHCIPARHFALHLPFVFENRR